MDGWVYILYIKVVLTRTMDQRGSCFSNRFKNSFYTHQDFFSHHPRSSRPSIFIFFLIVHLKAPPPILAEHIGKVDIITQKIGFFK